MSRKEPLDGQSHAPRAKNGNASGVDAHYRRGHLDVGRDDDGRTRSRQWGRALATEDQTAAKKGLKSGALGLISSTVVGVASTAPAYSLAATLGFVVVLIGPKSPIVTILAFVPMLLISFAYNELNKADPDCGTIFTWGTRAFGPRTGWMGGWAIVAADVLVMASLAQIAGQYVFLLVQRQRDRERREQWVGAVGRGSSGSSR